MSKPLAIPAFFVSYGEEEYFLDRDIQKLKKVPDRSITWVSGSDISEAELIGLLEAGTIEERGRLLILDNAHKLKAGKVLKAYIESKDAKDTSTVLAAIVRSGKLPAIWAEAGKKGKLTKHEKLSTWETKNEVIPWIEAESKRAGLLMDHKTATQLYQYVGASLYRLSSEIQKLSVLVPKGAAVSNDHLKLIVSPTSTVEPFQVVEAASDKNVLKALNGLSRLYKMGSDDPSILLSYALMKQVEKLLIARSLLDQRTPEEDIAAQLSMHPWRCKNFFLPLARKHSVVGLTHMMRRLCELDMQMKSTSGSKRTLLELAIVALAS